MAESKEAYLVHATTLPELLMTLNFQLARIADRLDNLEGHRDRPRFYSNPQFRDGVAYRQVKVDGDKIAAFQTPVSAPTSIDVSGDDTIDATALNTILQGIYTILTNAEITEGYTSTGEPSEPPSAGDVTFGGEETTLGGEDTTW